MTRIVLPPMVSTGAMFSSDNVYRYSLWRIWDAAEPPLMIIGLNPSTATAITNDPTISREIRYAMAWGHGGLIKTNLFGYRSTDPAALREVEDPVGPNNNLTIRRLTREPVLIKYNVLGRYVWKQYKLPSMVLAAWGKGGLYLDQHQKVLDFLPKIDIYCLGRNREGTPTHPLYQRADLRPTLYRAAVA
jgi:hypothetical protein